VCFIDYYIALESRSGQKARSVCHDEPQAVRIVPGEDAESVMLNLVSNRVRPAVLLPSMLPKIDSSAFARTATSSCAAPNGRSLSLGSNPHLRALRMLVMDGFAEPFDGMPYTDGLGREICVDVSFDQYSAITIT
jgi:hypothetical protein